MVTAAITWLLHPRMERRIRHDVQTEQAIAELLAGVLDVRHRVFALTLDVPYRNRDAARSLKRIGKLVTPLRVTAIRTGRRELMRTMNELIAAVSRAQLAVQRLAETKGDEPLDSDGKLSIPFPVGEPLARGLPSEMTDGEHEGLHLVQDLVDAAVEARDTIASAAGMSPESFGPFDTDFGETIVERDLARSLFTSLVNAVRLSPGVCRVVGDEVQAVAAGKAIPGDGAESAEREAASIAAELGRLRQRNGLCENVDAETIGSACIDLMLMEKATGEFPLLTSITAEMFAESVRNVD